MKGPAAIRVSSGAGVLLSSLAVLLAGCASNPEELDVLVSFERGTSSWTREATARVDIHIIPSCENLPPLGSSPEEILASTYVPKNGDPGPTGGQFEAKDSFGLYAMGRNDECFVIAAGCKTIDAENEEPLTVSMRAVQVFGPPCPAGEQCLGDGECVNSPCAGLDERTDCTFDEVQGQCRSGICCTGCWDGTICRPGDEPNFCGTAGERCDNFCP